MREVTIRLQDDEIPAKVNKRTSEITEVNSRPNNIPDGKEVFEAGGIFLKTYTKSWRFLQSKLTPFEFKVAFQLAMMAKANTNSLEPLNDDTTVNQLADILNVSRNKVTPILNKLFKLGVYAKFEVVKPDVPYTKYWILNPYLSFSGKLIYSDIADLFKGTTIELEYSREFI